MTSPMIIANKIVKSQLSILSDKELANTPLITAAMIIVFPLILSPFQYKFN